MTHDFEMLGSLPGAIGAAGIVLAGAYALGRLAIGQGEQQNRLISLALLQLSAGLVLLGWLSAVLGTLQLLAGWKGVVLLGATGIGGLVAVGVVVNEIVARRRALPSRQEHPASIQAKRPRRVRAGSRTIPRGASHRTAGEPSRWRHSLLIGTTVLAGLITLGPALCYPTGWDELVYHHELPRRWLAEGWPAVYPDLPYSGFPSGAELLFWVMAPLEGVIAPRLLMWCCWMLGLAGVYLLLRRRLALFAAATLTAAFALSGTLLMISQNCYVESWLLLDMAALMLAVEMRPRPSHWRHAVLMGLLAGGASAVKLTGVVITLLPLAWYAIEVASGRQRLRIVVPTAAVFSLVAAVVVLPFYLRPWLATGNPFYPYYAPWFTQELAALEMSRFHHALGAAFGVHTPAAFFTGPILLAAELKSDINVYDGSFGWQLLVVLFLAVVALLERRPRRRMFVVWPAFVAASLYVFWFFTAQQARFAIPAILGLTLLGASGLQRIHGGWRLAILWLLMIATMVSLPTRADGHYLGSWLTALGLVSRADYVAVSTGGRDPTDRHYVPLVEAIAEHTPPDARLMVLFEHRGFYLPRRHEIGTPLFQEANFMPPEDFRDPQRVLEHLRERKITHVLYPNAPAGPDQVQAEFDRQAGILPLFGELTNQGHLEVVWLSDRYFLLEVKPQATQQIAP